MKTDWIHGMAHITGGGIEGNLCRVIPEGLAAEIDLGQLRVPNIFTYIRNNAHVSDEEMLHTFNCGAGLLLVVDDKDKQAVIGHVSEYYSSYEIGTIKSGEKKVTFSGRVNWG